MSGYPTAVQFLLNTSDASTPEYYLNTHTYAPVLHLNLEVLEPGQVVSVLPEHLVDHLPGLGERENGCGQRVVGDSLEDQAGVTGKGRWLSSAIGRLRWH